MSAVAALDCGTNALRLLVSDDGVDLAREMRTVRLGENVDKTGMFAPAALTRTFVALDEYVDIMKRHNVLRVRFVATSASRDVSNRDEFVAGIHARLGIEPEVISGDEEATLSFAGATQSLDVQRPTLVIDLGGGSTEFVLGDAAPWSARSVNIGCVRMTERHLHSDPATPSEIAAAIGDIDEAIDLAAESVDLAQAMSLIGVAGTVTTVAAMAHGLPAYDATRIHGLVTTPDVVQAVADELLLMTRAERAALPFMHPGRVDVIGAGALVLARVTHRVGLPVIASEHDLLDAIAAQLSSA